MFSRPRFESFCASVKINALAALIADIKSRSIHDTSQVPLTHFNLLLLFPLQFIYDTIFTSIPDNSLKTFKV